MFIDYYKRDDNRSAFTVNVFKKFTDAVGGNPVDFAALLYAKYTVEDFAYSDDMYYFGVEKYFEDKVVPHKIAVYEAGKSFTEQVWFNDLKVDKDEFIYNLWVHDLSKFSANEAFGYAMYNFENPSEHSKEGFELAWHHHKMHNEHHPEYWLNPNRSGILEPLKMPTIFILEMIADWTGAGKTYGSTLEKWLPKNLNKFKFHPDNIPVIKNILQNLGIKTVLEPSTILTAITF